MKLIFLTGATGFVGSELVATLRAQNYEVHALARPNADRAFKRGAEVHWHTGDLVQPESLSQALAATAQRATTCGAELLAVHNAAVISYRSADRDLQWRVNVEGTRNFFNACRDVGVKRVVHVSSVVAVGTAPNAGEELNEEAEFNGASEHCDYTDTKRAGEQIALSFGQDLEVVVVNPGAIYGPARVLSNTSRFLALLREKPALGRFAPPGSVSCVGVADVADGIARALECGQSGRRYLLTESNWRWCELYQRAGELNQTGIHTRTVPGPIWRGIAASASVIDRLRPRSFATPQALRLLRIHFRFSSQRARTELGWSPRPFDEILRETVLWLSQRNSV